MKNFNKLFVVGWNVAYRKKGDKTFTVIKNNFNSWTADPFVFEYNGEVYIFAEIYNFDRWQGCLGYCKLENGKFSKWKEIIIENYHLSFPNIQLEHGEIYIYPESEQSETFYRYKAIEFPDKWIKEKILINNRRLVDSVFFTHNHKKYFMTYDINKNPKELLLCNVKNGNIDIDNCKMINNKDSEARLGGKILKINNDLIRVAQDCEEFYGKSLKFYKFEFDGTNYDEKLLKEVNASDINLNKKGKFYGIHTYNSSDNYEVIDLKINKFIPYGIIGKAKKKLKNLFAKFSNIRLFGRVKIAFLYFFAIICKIFPVDKNKIIMSNFYGKGYGDNLKPIAEELLKTHPDYKIYWSVKNIYENMPDKITKVKIHSFREVYHLSTSKVWIDNNRKFRYALKRKNQFYIQTWHGGYALKKIEKEALSDLPSNYEKFAKRDSKKIDIMISNSESITNKYRNLFWYDGPIAEIGIPRNDIFFKDNSKLEKDIKNLLNLHNEFIILYAPTFRNYNFDYLQINFEKLINEYKKRYNKDCKILFRLHPSIKVKINNNKNIIDVSNYPTLEELLIITDLLISDFSSIIFDFLYTKKEIYLFAPDYDEYVNEKGRGLAVNYKDLPFSKSYTSDELIKNIILGDSRNYNEALKSFLQKEKFFDNGNSTKIMIKMIENMIEKNKIEYK